MKTQSSSRGWTYVGLVIALLGGPLLIAAQTALTGRVSNVPETLVRELMLFGLAALLLLLILRGERLPLSSIGLKRDHVGRTLLLGLGIFVALGAASAAILGLLHVVGLPLPSFPGFVPPPSVLTLVIIRAGIVEEIFYRGYAIERLESLTKSKWVAAVVPLICFTLAHFKGGISGMAVALVLGAVLTFFYMWKRNLAANILGHFLIDFVPNVLLPSLAG
jgi:membrane protease YdiL (CAAX protease family)